MYHLSSHLFLRKTRARAPTFRPGISPVNINTIVDTLAKLKYTGPLALAWDDTSIEKVISICKESPDTYAILGSGCGVFHISDEADLDELFESAQLNVADKVRCSCTLSRTSAHRF